MSNDPGTEDATLLVRCVQTHSVPEPEHNLPEVLDRIAEARADGVDLLAFPETTSSRLDAPGAEPVAQRLDEGFVAAVAAATATGAGGSGPTVVVGTVEAHPDGPPFNTLVALRGGAVVARYRKVHLYDAFSFTESRTISPGDGRLETFRVKGFHIGLVNCYDLRFPEISRLLAERGAEVLLAPASWVAGPLKEEHWSTLCRARALENTCYLVAPAQTGGNRIGRSAVVAPDGTVRATAGQEVTTVTHRLTRSALLAARRAMPVLAQRRFRVDPVPLPHGAAPPTPATPTDLSATPLRTPDRRGR
ncbi:carbon-nitrogen hydrolase family protein [Streptomyces sp. NPDC049906]|uniref:carbon-nitrogen hydrolase family protein n=1 Tax=Streptomyces sp. NPDC049906 TaxID=3155656 RepID=UPI0034470FB8